jgi:diguanylate cyclase (GGDEF)-like protein
MPNTDEAGALHIAERICLVVEAEDIPHSGNPHGRVTVSIGVASCMVHDGDTADALVRAADLALYRAKDGGRNRTVCAGVIAIAPPQIDLQGGVESPAVIH